MRILFLLLLLSVAGCALFSKDGEEDETKNWTVERLYAEAKDALYSGYYKKAVEYYEFLETRFPFGVYGQQSLLDLAYAYYKTEDAEAATAACDRFIKLYPQNPHVDYAYYLKGLINFNKGKGFTERFLPMDLSQRDQSPSLTAFDAFAELLEKYPHTQYAEDAQKRMVYLRENIAKHEIHIANYYMKRGAYIAAANRARYVVESYQRTPSVPDGLIIMARSYRVLEMDDLFDDTMRVLDLNYPNHPGLREVRQIKVR
ncbi:MAG: outer membrane protein assembly factor BamD [Gammaproteobacteria bacterium]